MDDDCTIAAMFFFKGNWKLALKISPINHHLFGLIKQTFFPRNRSLNRLRHTTFARLLSQECVCIATLNPFYRKQLVTNIELNNINFICNGARSFINCLYELLIK